MTARIGKVRLKRDGDRVRLERVRGYRSVSDRIGQRKQADREERKWRAKGKTK